MLSKKEVKYIQSLGHKRQRDEDKVFVAEGPKMAAELLKSNFEIKHVYATPQWLDANIDLQVPFTEINEIDLKRISQLQTPNQVVIVAGQQTNNNLPALSTQITLVLDGLQDPGNMGTIIRIADWFGIKQMVCSPDCADIYNLKVVQATMGSILRVNCFTTNLEEWLPAVKLPVYGALLQGKNVYETPKINEVLLVIGNESKGIRSNIASQITHPVTIPRMGEAESLNAAVAAGILLSHLVGS